MDAKTENTIRHEQIESFGRLIAGFAHDMKNHLGIIRESNGLMDDLIAMGTLDEDDKMVERLKKSIVAIERRVVISANMLHHLSGLAHRPDTPYSSFLVNDLIKEEYVFLERFSRLKQVAVVLELGEAIPAVYNDPALLQHILYRLYTLCLTQLETDHTLTILTEQEGHDMVITFRVPGSSQMGFRKLLDNSLHAAIEKLAGKIEIDATENDPINIRLIFSSLPVDATP